MFHRDETPEYWRTRSQHLTARLIKYRVLPALVLSGIVVALGIFVDLIWVYLLLGVPLSFLLLAVVDVILIAESRYMLSRATRVGAGGEVETRALG